MVTTPNPAIAPEARPIAAPDDGEDVIRLSEDVDGLPESMEEVDGVLVEKTGMTVKHAAVQGNILFFWRDYIRTTQCGGEVYPEVPCITDRQKRRPDVAYVTPDLLAMHGRPAIFPQSFPLIAEVASPDDKAELLLSKAREYLGSGAEEVWLLFPENQLVMIATQTQWQVFTAQETIATQILLPGFAIAVAELFA